LARSRSPARGNGLVSENRRSDPQDRITILYSDTQVSGRTHEFGLFFLPKPGAQPDSTQAKRPPFLGCPARPPSPKNLPGPLLSEEGAVIRARAGWHWLLFPPRSRFLGSLGCLSAICGKEFCPPEVVCWRKEVLSLRARREHVGNLERFGLRVDNIDRRRNPLLSRDRQRGGAGRVMSSRQVKLLVRAKIRSIGVCLGSGRRSGPIVTKARFTTEL
jgi:hypothetical protein